MKYMGRIILAILCANQLFAVEDKPVPLTQRGKELTARYSQQLKDLQTEIGRSVPRIAPQKKDAYLAAHGEEKKAKAEFESAQKLLGRMEKTRGGVDNVRKYRVLATEKRIAETKTKLANATVDTERETLQAELKKWQEKLEAGLKRFKELQDDLAVLEKDEAKTKRDYETAKAGYAQAQAKRMAALDACELRGYLDNDELDGLLVKCAVLSQATPRGLALFAQQSPEHEQLVETLLADSVLMQQMVVAGGARDGKWGEAMKIYTDIQKVSEHARKPGILQRLAIGTSLEMVVQYRQSYTTYLKGDIKPIDPVKRYLHYEKAYLAGELDPDFKDMTAWECRWIVCDPASNEELAWLRTMIRNYRPDLPRDPDPRWHYSRIIKTDVRYTMPKWDPSLPVTRLQEAIDKGGICHIRAWIARSTARAHGIPALRVEEEVQ